MADFCVDKTQQAEFDEKVVCGLWQCEALRASQKQLHLVRRFGHFWEDRTRTHGEIVISTETDL